MSNVLLDVSIDIHPGLIVDVRTCSSTFQQRRSNSSVWFEIFHGITINLRRGEGSQ
jgi:hypothetical protein